MAINKEKIEFRRCSKCDSTMVYIRKKKNERVCRSCGYIEEGEEVINNETQNQTNPQESQEISQ